MLAGMINTTAQMQLRTDAHRREEDPVSRLIAAATSPVRGFAERRLVVLGSALVIAAAIFLTRELIGGSDNASSFGYFVPVALVALELGLVAGVAAALFAVLAVLAWMLTTPTDLGALSLIVRALSYLALGVIAGRFSDIMRSTRVRDQRLLRAGIDLARLEDRGSLAKLLVEHIQQATDPASVAVTIDGVEASSASQPDGEQLTLPVVSHGVRVGFIQVSAGAGRRFKQEDRLTLQTLALQAAIASDNQRLIAMQREQATLQTEIERMRRRLDQQVRNASQVIGRHEQERGGIARQLREEAAQTMAAALLTVTMLQRAPSELSQAQLQDVRDQVKMSIADLRRLAATLRPSVLDELGLASALQRVAEIEAERNGRSVTFSFAGLHKKLPAHVETSTYRAIEEVLEALSAAPIVAVDVHADQERVRVVVAADAGADAVRSVQADAGVDAVGSVQADAGADAVRSVSPRHEPAHEGAREGVRGEANHRASPALSEAASQSHPRAAHAAQQASQPHHSAPHALRDAYSYARSELAATKARLELIGGSLQIHSLGAAGARIVAELPIS